MDLRLYARVLSRFKVILALGLVAALALATLSLIRVSTRGISYRQSEIWSSTARLLVTQAGFPEGRLYGQAPVSAVPPKTPVVDPGRFNNLAVLYAQLATSDSVRALMRREGPIRGEIIATPVVGGGEFKTPLPMIDLTALSTSRVGAIRLAERAADALTRYIQKEQQASEVPTADRAVITPVVRARRATLYRPRPKTMPIVVFLAVMFTTVGLAFLLENLRPRVGEPDAHPAAFEGAQVRRMA